MLQQAVPASLPVPARCRDTLAFPWTRTSVASVVPAVGLGERVASVYHQKVERNALRRPSPPPRQPATPVFLSSMVSPRIKPWHANMLERERRPPLSRTKKCLTLTFNATSDVNCWVDVQDVKDTCGTQGPSNQGKPTRSTRNIADIEAHQRGFITKPQPYGVPRRIPEPDQWDVVGLGQAMVDFSAMVSHEFLESLGLPRGERVIVDHEERGQVLQALDGCAYKLSAGGSLSNTLVALARLGRRPRQTPQSASVGQTSVEVCSDAMSRPERTVEGNFVRGELEEGRLNVAMVGSVGSDALGDFYRTKLLRANVHFLSPSIPGGTTGTVIVLTTPDAQRTMLSYQGMSSTVSMDAAMEAVVGKSRVLVIEGYLWELPQTVDAIAAACASARSQGLLVALTASDASCVLRHRPKFWSVLCRSAHILFANTSEARALAGCSEEMSVASLAQYLSRFCPLVAVTDGELGSYLGLRGHVVHIPAYPCIARDTCGAGDAYAAGVLYALLMGAPDLEAIGNIAARVSATVVSQQGARLREEDAEVLAEALAFSPSSLVEGQVFHSMMSLQDVSHVPVAGTGGSSGLPGPEVIAGSE